MNFNIRKNNNKMLRDYINENVKSVLLMLFLFVELLVLTLTINISHVSEHILIAAIIGYISILIVLLFSNQLLFIVGYLTGTLYYLGREIRDFEKTDSDFDYGGFLGPAFGNIITFLASYYLYKIIKNKNVIKISNV